MQKKHILLLILLISTQISAVTFKEIQEIRLAKAELALQDNDVNQALKLLKKNLSKRSYHPESYLLLAKIFKKKGYYSKAFKTYYYMAKTQHSSKLILLKRMDKLPHIVKSIPKPDENSLDLYFLIATTYFDAYYSEHYPENFKKELLKLSMKYLDILETYKYRPQEVAYQKALTQKELKNYYQALTHLVTVNEFINKDSALKEKDVSFTLAETLISSGQYDAGMIFLQTIENSPASNPVLQKYASTYLKAFKSEGFFAQAGLGLGHDSNVHGLTDEEQKNVAGTSLKRVDGTYSTKSGYLTHSNTLHRFWSTSQFIQISENLYQDKAINYYDSRTFYYGAQLKYHNMIKSSGNLFYSLTHAYDKDNDQNQFQTSSLSHHTYLQYTHLLKSGHISYQIPFTFTDYKTGNNTFGFGANLQYVPFRFNNYFRPSYLFEFLLNDEQDGPFSKQISAGFSNHFYHDQHLQTFLNLKYLTNINSVQDYDYSELSAGMNLTYTLPLWTSLYVAGSYNFSKISYATGREYSKYTWTLNANYRF